uniref:Uncharacterized protein n=1 Tax=Glossina palpalis gambiensis TaxID=67801 RepID=A0A1B0BQP3_9MUSC
MKFLTVLSENIVKTYPEPTLFLSEKRIKKQPAVSLSAGDEFVLVLTSSEFFLKIPLEFLLLRHVSMSHDTIAISKFLLEAIYNFPKTQPLLDVQHASPGQAEIRLVMSEKYLADGGLLKYYLCKL